jgi:hypothetical protein
MTTPQLFIAFLALALLLWKLSAIAGRLDRVHIRRDQALTSLRLQLAWRTSSVAKLLTTKSLDPVSANILMHEITAVSSAAERSLLQYMAAESELTRALSVVFEDADDVQELISISPDIEPVLRDLAHACRRVELARRFHNDAVGAAQLLHKRKIVRYFRLAGHTELPSAIDVDDTVPAGLEIL